MRIFAQAEWGERSRCARVRGVASGLAAGGADPNIESELVAAAGGTPVLPDLFLEHLNAEGEALVADRSVGPFGHMVVR